jgi:hypothetical protein
MVGAECRHLPHRRDRHRGAKGARGHGGLSQRQRTAYALRARRRAVFGRGCIRRISWSPNWRRLSSIAYDPSLDSSHRTFSRLLKVAKRRVSAITPASRSTAKTSAMQLKAKWRWRPARILLALQSDGAPDTIRICDLHHRRWPSIQLSYGRILLMQCLRKFLASEETQKAILQVFEFQSSFNSISSHRPLDICLRRAPLADGPLTGKSFLRGADLGRIVAATIRAMKSMSAGIIVVFGAAGGAYGPNVADKTKPHHQLRVPQRCYPSRPLCVSTT